MKTTKQLVATMGLEPDVALDFFVTFARLEFALLASGYRKEIDKKTGQVGADWKTFGGKLITAPKDDLQASVESPK